MNSHPVHHLRLKNLGIDSYRENIVFMRSDCHICISEGFRALTRVVVHAGLKSIIATLNVVNSEILGHGEVGLSLEAMKRLESKEGDMLSVTHLHPIVSLGKVRSKVFGKRLDESSFHEIIQDIVHGHYSNIEIAAFVTSCAGDNLSIDEIIALTKAMIYTGQKMLWKRNVIVDKHCVGGLPGNRTTPIVVSIVAAAGLTIPKTSSRAITSPAGTADVMETMTTVDLTIEKLQQIVEQEGGCIAWGGAVNLSPADDILISVEKALDVDSAGQMIASVLSKKIAAGSTHVVIDIPVGPTAKVRSKEEALKLQYYFTVVGNAIGIQTVVLITDGTQPVGKGIGPVLEALDVLSVLKNEPAASSELRERALTIAGEILKLSGEFVAGTESTIVREILESGKAYNKFIAICKAQGGFRVPVMASHKYEVHSTVTGIVKAVDNRKLARIAKLAGAPKVPSAGVLFNVVVGQQIKSSDLLFTIYAESKGELEYAIDFMKSNLHIIMVE